jgi:protein SCO1/2
MVPVLLGLAIVVGCAGPDGRADRQSGAVITTVGGGVNFRGMETNVTKPAVTLTDTDGEPFDLATDTTAAVTLIFFGYTSCPDVCTLVLRQVAAGLNKLDEAARQRIEVVFITTDPARDTPEKITAYLDRFGFTSYVGLTGPVSTIEKAATPLQVRFYTDDKGKLPGGPYEVVHGAHVIGFGPNGRSVLWTKDTPVADLAHDFALLAA